MFEVTTRLPNSFAFKNQSKPLHSHESNNHHYTPTSSQLTRDHRIAYPFSVSSSANTYRPMRHDMPVYFGQSNSANHLGESSFVSRSNPRVNISNPYFNEHNDTNSSSKPPLLRTEENVTVLPVYYKSDNKGTNLPTISNSASSSPSLKSPSHVHKIRINGSQILPSLSGGDNSHHYHTGESHSSNFHQQLAAHQRRMNSLDRLNIINGSPHGQRSHSLNMNPYNSLPHGNVNNGNQQSVIYSHDATMPTFSTVSTSAMDDTKMSVIKSIKARQDMFLSKHMKMNPQEEKEENRYKYNFEDTKKTQQQEENELNLLKQNFNYLFLTNKNNTSYKNLNSSSQFKNSQNISQTEANYRNTLLNMDKKLRSIKTRQGSVDRLRLEVNNTPISDVSSVASSNKGSNSSPISCMLDASAGTKSILVKKNKGIKVRKSVSFAEC